MYSFFFLPAVRRFQRYRALCDIIRGRCPQLHVSAHTFWHVKQAKKQKEGLFIFGDTYCLKTVNFTFCEPCEKKSLSDWISISTWVASLLLCYKNYFKANMSFEFVISGNTNTSKAPENKPQLFKFHPGVPLCSCPNCVSMFLRCCWRQRLLSACWQWSVWSKLHQGALWMVDTSANTAAIVVRWGFPSPSSFLVTFLAQTSYFFLQDLLLPFGWCPSADKGEGRAEYVALSGSGAALHSAERAQHRILFQAKLRRCHHQAGFTTVQLLRRIVQTPSSHNSFG